MSGMNLKDRLQIINSWDARLDILQEEKKMSRRAFCAKHRIHSSALSRYVNLVVMPDNTTVEKIEKCLKKEGV